jgi:hypothetical protein
LEQIDIASSYLKLFELLNEKGLYEGEECKQQKYAPTSPSFKVVSPVRALTPSQTYHCIWDALEYYAAASAAFTSLASS